jgi:hypothetical protein
MSIMYTRRALMAFDPATIMCVHHVHPRLSLPPFQFFAIRLSYAIRITKVHVEHSLRVSKPAL